MKPSVFECDDYRTYLEAMIAFAGNMRGYRTSLAQAAGCHNSFLSQVLKQSVQLLPEHALGIARFWELTDDETEFFVSLVHHARAGTPGMRAWLETKLKRIRAENSDLKKPFKTAVRPSEIEQQVYYSNWDYSAIHVLVGIPRFKTVRAIAAALHLGEERVTAILKDLEQFDFVRKESGSKSNWTRGKQHVHLDSDSLLFRSHQQHWRLKLAQEISANRPENLHYTGIHSLSAADALKIRKILVDSLDKIGNVARPSPEEELVAINLDLVRMT